ncbi:MAG: hypothetical protein QXL94_04055 [Candidatus Parvarchaeum sp.]
MEKHIDKYSFTNEDILSKISKTLDESSDIFNSLRTFDLAKRISSLDIKTGGKDSYYLTKGGAEVLLQAFANEIEKTHSEYHQNVISTKQFDLIEFYCTFSITRKGVTYNASGSATYKLADSKNKAQSMDHHFANAIAHKRALVSCVILAFGLGAFLTSDNYLIEQEVQEDLKATEVKLDDSLVSILNLKPDFISETFWLDKLNLVKNKNSCADLDEAAKLVIDCSNLYVEQNIALKDAFKKAFAELA